MRWLADETRINGRELTGRARQQQGHDGPAILSKQETHMSYKCEIDTINTTEDVDAVFKLFTASFTKADLYRLTEEYVKDMVIDESAFNHFEHGLVGHVMMSIVFDATSCSIRSLSDTLTARLCEHYKITKASMPPQLLFRMAVALHVRLNMVALRLSNEIRTRHSGSIKDILEVVQFAADDLVSPLDASEISDFDVNAFLEEIIQ